MILDCCSAGAGAALCACAHAVHVGVVVAVGRAIQRALAGVRSAASFQTGSSASIVRIDWAEQGNQLVHVGSDGTGVGQRPALAAVEHDTAASHDLIHPTHR